MKNVIILLDAGHGGIINGVYQTAGKRSPKWDDGSQLLEGVFNREIVNSLHQQLIQQGIDCRILVPEQEDISLSERVKRANKIYRENNAKCYLLSIHANAGGGEGFEIYTSPGQTKADAFAESIAEAYKKVFPDKKLRTDLSDGDLDKEAKFYILQKTAMSAALAEIGFMDNEDECRNLLMSTSGKKKIINFLMMGILASLRCECCGHALYGDS